MRAGISLEHGNREIARATKWCQASNPPASPWRMPRSWWVYILTNRSGTLYIGVTGDLPARLTQHRAGFGSRFARRYAMTRLVFVEESPNPYDAIRREKQLKSWSRARKVALINAANPEWEDLGKYVLPGP